MHIDVGSAEGPVPQRAPAPRELDSRQEAGFSLLFSYILFYCIICCSIIFSSLLFFATLYYSLVFSAMQPLTIQKHTTDNNCTSSSHDSDITSSSKVCLTVALDDISAVVIVVGVVVALVFIDVRSRVCVCIAAPVRVDPPPIFLILPRCRWKPESGWRACPSSPETSSKKEAHAWKGVKL